MAFKLLHQCGQAAVEGGSNSDDTDKIGDSSTVLYGRNVGATEVSRQRERFLRHTEAHPERDYRLPERFGDFGVG
jgi:hypothetical protein